MRKEKKKPIEAWRAVKKCRAKTKCLEGDALMLHQHREALQGRAKENRGGRSATMMYACPFTLCRRAVVATMDLSAANLDFFQKHHWLSDRRNVILLQLQQQAWV